MKTLLNIVLFTFLTAGFFSVSEASDNSTESRQSSGSSDLKEQFEHLATAALPVLKLQNNNQLYDYLVEIGNNKQEVGLRLDVAHGEVWVPNSDYFQRCYQTTNSNTASLTTTIDSFSSFNVPTPIISSNKTLTTVTLEDTTTTSVLPTSFTINMVDSVYVRSCAGFGIYSMVGKFLDLYDNLIVNLEYATQFIGSTFTKVLVSGIWVVDDFLMTVRYNNTFDSIIISNVPFVNANFSSVGVGALALGSSVSDYTYEHNFISNFVNLGLVSTNSYSLALNSRNGSSPQLILGGVNTEHIQKGNSYNIMAEFDFVPVLDESKAYITTNDGVTNSIPALPIYGWGVTANGTGQKISFSNSYNDRNTIANYPKPAILESRYFYNYIPYSTLVEMAVELNAVYSSDMDRWLVDCSVGDSGTLDLHLGNYTINMPISKFLFPASFNDSSLIFESGHDACFLAFLPDFYLGYSLLGTPLLKNIYLAVDNENKKLAVGAYPYLLEDNDIYIEGDDDSGDNSNLIESGNSTGLLERRDDYNQTEFTETPDISITTLSNSEYSFDITVTSKVTISSSVIKTTATIPIDQRVTGFTEAKHLYEIKSNTIPFASKFATVSDLTLTIPRSEVFTDLLVHKTQAVISNGEIYLETNANTGKTASTKATAQSETGIYGFTSLVSSIRPAKPSSAGASLNRVPSVVNFLLSMLHPLNVLNISVVVYMFGVVLAIAVAL